jgi:O-methyltransferase involved in polyketide biosynthesis
LQLSWPPQRKENHLSANEANIAVFVDHHARKAEPVETSNETDAGRPGNGVAPGLAGVPETMLWALHNRASEARRRDTLLIDPESIRIHEAIDYDFARHFGNPEGSLAVRAAEIDSVLRKWLEQHPDGFVVSLGEGLETQVGRVDNGRLRWLSVDLPAAMELRERFLAPTERFRHIAVSALDSAWMDAVDASSGVFIVAQGLLMYLEPDKVRRLLSDVADRFPGAEIVFDVVPRWFSRLTLWGLNHTPHYRLPSMPWGINRDEIEQTLRRWHPSLGSVKFLNYRLLRGLPFLLARLMQDIPVLRHEIPSLVHLSVATITCDATAIPQSTIFRKQKMTVINEASTDVDTIDGMFAEATRSAGRSKDLAIAAGKVVEKRVALGMKGFQNLKEEDHIEFGRMVPEKVQALAAAGMALLKHANHANQQMLGFASAEVMATSRAAIGIAQCSSPAAFMQAQGKFARAWFVRKTSNFIAAGMLSLEGQDAIMAPICQTVAANADRLG